jgi:predicted TPR repeat methyltransferase
LGDVAVRAVAIRPQFAAHFEAYNANIVAETLDFKPGEGFDLMVATNVLVYYNRLEQALAMANIARMLNPEGIFLANNVLPVQHTAGLSYLGRRTTTFTPSGDYGDDVVVYRRR